MSFCFLGTKLNVYFRGKYICNDSMQCSYTVCCGVQFCAVLWFCLGEHNVEQNLAYEKLLQFIPLFPSPSKEKYVCWQSVKRCTRLFATFDTTWLQHSCWCGYCLKRLVGLHVWYFACLLNFSAHYILYAVYVRALSILLLLPHL
jgi:hypothetical protein